MFVRLTQNVSVIFLHFPILKLELIYSFKNYYFGLLLFFWNQKINKTSNAP